MKLGPAIAAALLKLDELGESDYFAKFAMVGRYNTMRHLRRRKFVVDLNEPARKAFYARRDYEACQSPNFPPRWVLTEAGRAAVAALKRAEDIP